MFLSSKIKICTSLGVSDISYLSEMIEKAFDYGTDLIEIRVDYLQNIDSINLNDIIKKNKDKCILTCRAQNEGGKFTGNENERIQLLDELINLRPKYLDIELSLAKINFGLVERIKREGIDLIISWHDFRSTPKYHVLREIFNQAMNMADIVKIVTTASSYFDNLSLLELYKLTNKDRLIAFCMGETGQISRILCPILGAPFTYASLPDFSTAPAQMSIKYMRELYDLLWKKNYE